MTETLGWITTFLSFDFRALEGKVTVIICPPYPFLSLLKEKTAGLPFVKIGSQDVSFFYQGAYTGEVGVHSLTSLADYAIIGHSERRAHFSETDQTLFAKVEHAQKNGIEPIYCVRGADDKLPPSVKIIAYEPVSAIGTGQSDSVENILAIKKSLNLPVDHVFIYGGSVTENNAHQYLKNPDISGVLLGGASLDPTRFYNIVMSAV